MALKRAIGPSLILGLACLVLMAGCGIKSLPIESSKLLPEPASGLSALHQSDGVRISFQVPSADTPGKRIEEVILLRGYLPPEGDPNCPPCPPRLTQKNVFDLTKQLAVSESGRFTWLDEDAPMGMQAVYQVILVDAAGRQSNPSGFARAYRLPAPVTPQNLKARMGDNEANLRWSQVTQATDGKPLPVKAQYLVQRRGPDGIRTLSQRPQSATNLTDKTVTTGQNYAYRVLAVRVIGSSEVRGEPGPWVLASIREGQPLRPPSGLRGASQAGGIFLRFTPSPDRDANGYFIERAFGKEGLFERLNPEPVLENTFVDRDAKPGPRFYRVIAVGEEGDVSQPSETLEIRHQP